MRKRQQKSPTRNIVRYLRQATWSKNKIDALRDRIRFRRKKEKLPYKK